MSIEDNKALMLRWYEELFNQRRFLHETRHHS
jgi:hypothetical protein